MVPAVSAETYGVEKYVVPVSAQTHLEPTFYGAASSIFITKAEPISLYFHHHPAASAAVPESGSDSKTSFGAMPIGHYDLHPTAWSGSTAGSVVFIYKSSGL
jgi:hypothetical protein